jgi:thioredoxin-like negative regulator of GroEL
MRTQLEALTRTRSDVKLRIVDIDSWSSPVARQYTVRQLPTLWLFRDGKEVCKGLAEVMSELNSLR